MTRIVSVLVVLSALLMMQGCVQHNSRGSETKDEGPRTVQIYVDLGLGYLRQGKLDLALEKLKHALDMDDDNPEANHYIAEVYKQIGETELADMHYYRALKETPENPMLLNNYGAFLCGELRFKDAEEYFLRAASIKRYRTPELSYENLALCAQRTGKDNDKAEMYFRKALGIKPDLPKSLFQMSQLNFEKKDFFRARAFLERFHSVAGETEQSLQLGVKIEQALDNQAGVREYKRILKARYPQVELME